MKVKVMYFARYRELLGVDAERVEGAFKVLDEVAFFPPVTGG